MKHLMVAILMLASTLGMAQTRPNRGSGTETNYVDLRSGNYIPLSNCEIYRYKADYNKCKTLSNVFAKQKNTWELDGYAVNCQKDIVNRDAQRMCLDLNNLILTDGKTLDCYSQYVGVGLEFNRCLEISSAYARGYFDQTKQGGSYCYNCDVQSEQVVVVPAVTNYDVSAMRNQCYVNAYETWRKEKEKREKEGAALTVVGVGVGILGQIIAGTSNNQNGRVAGNIVTGIGAVVAVAGLYEMSSAGFNAPYNVSECRQYYQYESRPVVIENQQCTTTRYYTSSWGRTEEYFETVCTTHTYYSFERDSRFWY